MKDYLKGLYADFKINNLKSNISVIVSLICTLPVIFPVIAMDACHNGANIKYVAYITVLNAIILWVFILLALL